MFIKHAEKSPPSSLSPIVSSSPEYVGMFGEYYEQKSPEMEQKVREAREKVDREQTKRMRQMKSLYKELEEYRQMVRVLEVQVRIKQKEYDQLRLVYTKRRKEFEEQNTPSEIREVYASEFQKTMEQIKYMLNELSVNVSVISSKYQDLKQRYEQVYYAYYSQDYQQKQENRQSYNQQISQQIQTLRVIVTDYTDREKHVQDLQESILFKQEKVLVYWDDFRRIQLDINQKENEYELEKMASLVQLLELRNQSKPNAGIQMYIDKVRNAFEHIRQSTIRFQEVYHKVHDVELKKKVFQTEKKEISKVASQFQALYTKMYHLFEYYYSISNVFTAETGNIKPLLVSHIQDNLETLSQLAAKTKQYLQSLEEMETYMKKWETDIQTEHTRFQTSYVDLLKRIEYVSSNAYYANEIADNRVEFESRPTITYDVSPPKPKVEVTPTQPPLISGPNSPQIGYDKPNTTPSNEGHFFIPVTEEQYIQMKQLQKQIDDKQKTDKDRFFSPLHREYLSRHLNPVPQLRGISTSRDQSKSPSRVSEMGSREPSIDPSHRIKEYSNDQNKKKSPTHLSESDTSLSLSYQEPIPPQPQPNLVKPIPTQPQPNLVKPIPPQPQPNLVKPIPRRAGTPPVSMNPQQKVRGFVGVLRALTQANTQDANKLIINEIVIHKDDIHIAIDKFLETIHHYVVDIQISNITRYRFIVYVKNVVNSLQTKENWINAIHRHDIQMFKEIVTKELITRYLEPNIFLIDSLYGVLNHTDIPVYRNELLNMLKKLPPENTLTTFKINYEELPDNKKERFRTEILSLFRDIQRTEIHPIVQKILNMFEYDKPDVGNTEIYKNR